MKQIGTGLIVALMVLLTLSGCATTSVRQHPDFASGKRKINVVAILPPQVEYRHLVFTGENERDAAREESISTDIASTMSDLLKTHGYTAKTDILDKARSGDKEFNFQLEQFKGAYLEAAKELYAQPLVPLEQSSAFKVGVGPLANPFANISGADALMLVRYDGFDKSSGLMTKEVVASALLAVLTGSYYVPAQNGGRVELSLIDGISGNVLWSNAAGGPVSEHASLLNAAAALPSVVVPVDTKVAAGNMPTTEAASTTVPAPKVENGQVDKQPTQTEAVPQPAPPEKTP